MLPIDLNESLKRCCDALKNCQCEPDQEYQDQHITDQKKQRQQAEEQLPVKVEPVPLLSELQKSKAR